jgi:hypothetical protein
MIRPTESESKAEAEPHGAVAPTSPERTRLLETSESYECTLSGGSPEVPPKTFESPRRVEPAGALKDRSLIFVARSHHVDYDMLALAADAKEAFAIEIGQSPFHGLIPNTNLSLKLVAWETSMVTILQKEPTHLFEALIAS